MPEAPTEFNLADLFESVVDAIPDRIALVCGDRRLTYAQLEERANRLAHHLLASGIARGDHVGIQLYNGTEYVETILATIKIRAVPININYRYVAGELNYLYRDADIAALVYQGELGERVVEAVKDVPTLKHVIAVERPTAVPSPEGAVDFDSATASASTARDFAHRSGDDMYMIYTGGTTGTPKGVMWRQEDLFFAGMGGGNPTGEPVTSPGEIARNVLERPAMVMFPVPPLMHGAAQLGTFIAFFGGGTAVMVRQFDPAAVLRMIEREKVNTMNVVGDAMARPLADALAAGLEADTSSLLVISSAGAILSRSVRDQLQKLLPNVGLLDNFGASETGFQGMGTPDCSPDTGLIFKMNPRTAVFDDELRPVQPGSGVLGRLALKDRIPLGYYKDQKKTDQTFTMIDGVRWVMQGDLATVNEDGTVTVFGRGAVCINSGGEKIFPEEVEAALKSHPNVFDAVVVGTPDERWGERVTAVVASRDGEPSLEDLVQHCESRIARYKLPRALVAVEEIKRSPSGKPDYAWARKLAREAAGTVAPAAAG
jgi:acyl-CoA synthetase (AMP-forming)/AMP-acid ligase II